MRKSILLIAGVACAIAMASDSSAAVRTFWDQQLGKWVKYDTAQRGSGARAYTPINRKTVKYNGPFRPNTIVINTSERRLYLVLDKGKALKYGVGVGRDGFQWSGSDWVSAKAEWPGWTPPPEMIARERAKGRILPDYMPGGINNPLGARALYIGGSIYRIHGSNEPWSIGHAVSSGCIRLTNDDIVDLYKRVKVGTRVVVLTGKESKARLAALSVPPARKVAKPAAPAVATSGDRVKDDVTGSVAVGPMADASAPAAPEIAAPVAPAAAAAPRRVAH